MSTNISVNTSNDTERVVGGVSILGGATLSAFAAKTIIVAGFAAHLIPIIGAIVGIALILFGSSLFYFAWKKDQADHQSLSEGRNVEVLPQPFQAPLRLLPGKKTSSEELAASQVEISDPEQEKILDAPVAENPPSEQDPLALNVSDKFMAGSNLVQWGLIGAGMYGVAPTIIMPLSVLAGLGSEVATFCALPKDASWLRKAMSIPVLSKAILNYNPWISKFLQAVNFCNLVQSSGTKLKAAWGALQADPAKAVKAGAVHLFNLASGVIFAADSVGLIKLSPAKSPSEEEEQNFRKEREKTGEANTKTSDQGRQESVQRKIRIATVYHNTGAKKEIRQAISDATTANHKKYAEHWGLEHDVVTDNLVKGQCENPLTRRSQDCSLYWNKIKYFKNWCESPRLPGTEEWAIYADDDAVYTNFQVDPSNAIDQLRGKNDSSFIIATEGKGTRYNAGAVNTGVMIVRKDPRGCNVIEKIWENRNAITDIDKRDCPTYGLCKDQSNGDEQGATDKVFWKDAPQLLNKDITRIMARDATHPKRGHIAFNTVNRSGCSTALTEKGTLTFPFDIHIHDLNVNPDGVYQKGDWIAQTAGYPLVGQDLSHQPMGKCSVDASVPVEPIRLKKVLNMIRDADQTLQADPRGPIQFVPHHQEIDEDWKNIEFPKLKAAEPRPRKITFGAVYDNSADPRRNEISALTNQNHAEYAKRWGLKHAVVAENLVAGKCHKDKGKPADCAAYWNKIQMLRDWLSEPAEEGVEEWRYYADDDMLVTNMGIDPSKAIDELRGGHDTSFIVAEDVIDWQRWFFDKSIPHASVNTGAFIVRKDERAKNLVEEIWKLRDIRVLNPSPECQNIGACMLQEKSMQEQEALAILLRRQPSLINDVISVIPPRDTKSGTRAHLAMNTFYRDGCFVKKTKDGIQQTFTYEPMDQAENPEGAFKKGDWLVQAAGVPVWGKQLPFSYGKVCVDNRKVEESPVRLNKLKELSRQIVW